MANFSDWEGICSFMGFDDVQTMLKELYEVQHLSVHEIGRRIGVSAVGVRRQLHKNGINVRPQGGAVALPKKHYYLHLKDQRWVFSSTLAAIGKAMRMNPTYAMHYKRKSKGQPTDALQPDSANDDVTPSFE
jgi:hypothetical protein